MEQNTPNRGPSGSAIRFSCAFCGQQIRVSPVHAGKKAKCPNCKNIVIIPQPAPEPQRPKEDEPIRLKRDAEPPPRQVGLSPEQAQDWYRRSQEPTANAVIFSPPPEPKPATILDVFTFPFSLAGIIHFLLFWLGPVFLTGVLFVRFFLVGGLYYILAILFYAYLYYYLSHCVVAAARDERSAPDVSLGEFPAMKDLFSRLFMVFTAAGICFCPFTIYYLSGFFMQGWFWIVFISAFLLPMLLVVSFVFDLFSGFNPYVIIAAISNTLLLSYFYFFFFWDPVISRINTVYWLLLGIGVFMFPMFLLAALMFDSPTAFNPFLIVTSISSTFLSYCGLAILFCGIGLLMYLSRSLPHVLAILSWGIDIYLMFIAAYILGRFFRRYESKLNWEVKI
jgi:hypothetical protein